MTAPRGERPPDQTTSERAGRHLHRRRLGTPTCTLFLLLDLPCNCKRLAPSLRGANAKPLKTISFKTWSASRNSRAANLLSKIILHFLHLGISSTNPPASRHWSNLHNVATNLPTCIAHHTYPAPTLVNVIKHRKCSTWIPLILTKARGHHIVHHPISYNPAHFHLHHQADYHDDALAICSC